MAPDDDDVGYGCPPKAHRFQKGQSGNPKGRPKKANVRGVPRTVLEEVLTEELVMTIKGKRRKVSIGKAAAYQLVELAGRGNVSASRFLVNALSQIEANAAGAPVPGPDPEAEIVASLYNDMMEVMEVLLASGFLYIRMSGGFVFERSGFPQFFANCGPEFQALSKQLTFKVSDREYDGEGMTWSGDQPLLDLYIQLAKARRPA